MTQEEYNALGLARVNLDVPGSVRNANLRGAFMGAFRTNTQTPIPIEHQMYIPNNRFVGLIGYNRPGPNTSTSQFNPSNKYSAILRIIAQGLMVRDNNGQNGLL